MTRRLAGTGVSLADIRAIMLTHLDRDHFAPTWCAAMLHHGIALYVAERHVSQFHEVLRGHRTGPTPRQLHRAGLLRPFDGQPFALHDNGATASATPVHLAHDRAGTVGYVIRTAEHCLAYATDLGRVTDQLVDAMVDSDLLAIESNYDLAMQRASPRPAMLKRRIMSGHGHLSNDEALEAIRRVFARSRRAPAHVVLLHLSRQCNCPRLVRRLYQPHRDIASRLHVTQQHAPTGWLRLNGRTATLAGEQLTMF
jgi:ribonuclease BN (tRNA processing enzyme)